MIEELVVAAVSQALDKGKQAAAANMQEMTQDMGLPDLGGMLGQLGGGNFGQ